MYYITTKQSPVYHQMTIEELLFGFSTEKSFEKNLNESNTRTYITNTAPQKLFDLFDFETIMGKIIEFNKSIAQLKSVDRSSLYHQFPIPKKSGGLRQINAPLGELMAKQRELKEILEKDFKMLYHTSAYAYIKGRSRIDCMAKHQKNESEWYGKYDLSNFFGSITMEYTFQMMSQIFPFSEILKRDDWRSELEYALEIAFLNNELPQGTPLSPMLTNFIMIPFDHYLSNELRECEGKHFVYTRYADDFQITSRAGFDPNQIKDVIQGAIDKFESPFKLNHKKTRYGSLKGSNWNLGIMTNKDNNMTVGHRAKKQLQAMLHNYVKDREHGVQWDKNDVQVMNGRISCYRNVEGETIDRILEYFNQKMHVNVQQFIKEDLRA